MQIFKTFLIFIFLVNSVVAQRCDQQLIENLKTATSENLKDSENFQKLLNERAELALIKSSIVFYKLQENVKGNKKYLRQLEDQLEEHHKKGAYKRASSWAMIRYLKEKLELTSFQQPYTEEEISEIIEKNNRDRLFGKHGIADDIMIAAKLREQEEFPIEKMSETMYMRALSAPSYILFPKDEKKQLNSTDIYLLRKALKTDNKGNPTLLDFTLSQMKKHFSERNFPVNDELAMNAARENTVKKFKETFAKELADNIPNILKKLDQNCKDELKTLLSPANSKCAAGIILENNFKFFEDILRKMADNPEVQGIFLHVAGAKSKFNCEFEKQTDGKYKLLVNSELTNFEGINKSHWNLEAGDHKFPIQNKEGRVSFEFAQTMMFDDEKSIPKTAKFSHNEHINARLDITVQDKTSHTNEVDLTQCVNHPSNIKPAENTDGKDGNTDVNGGKDEEKGKKEEDPKDEKKEEEPQKEDEKFKMGLEKVIGDTSIKLKIKKHDKHECVFATCNAKSMKAKKDGCKLIKEQENDFKRKVDKPYNVYFQCREKGVDGAKYEPYKNAKGKEVRQYIGECESMKCFSLPKDDYRAPVIPPPPPQSPPQNISIPDMPILLEG